MKRNQKIVVGAITSFLIIYTLVKLFGPIKLTITVPKNYNGEIALVLSNTDKDILKVDENGIGYVTKRTFERAHSKPTVIDTDGLDVSDRCVGFSPSAFWAVGETSYATEEGNSQHEMEIQHLSFELVPKNKKGQKQYFYTDLLMLADKTKLYGN